MMVGELDADTVEEVQPRAVLLLLLGRPRLVKIRGELLVAGNRSESVAGAVEDMATPSTPTAPYPGALHLLVQENPSCLPFQTDKSYINELY